MTANLCDICMGTSNYLLLFRHGGKERVVCNTCVKKAESGEWRGQGPEWLIALVAVLTE